VPAGDAPRPLRVRGKSPLHCAAQPSASGCLHAAIHLHCNHNNNNKIDSNNNNNSNTTTTTNCSVRSYDTPRSRDKYSSMMLMDMIQVPTPVNTLHPLHTANCRCFFRAHLEQGEDLPEAEPDLDTNMVPLRLVDLLEKGRFATLILRRASSSACSLTPSCRLLPRRPPSPPHFSALRLFSPSLSKPNLQQVSATAEAPTPLITPTERA
jgi:hypothetical protein